MKLPELVFDLLWLVRAEKESKKGRKMREQHEKEAHLQKYKKKIEAYSFSRRRPPSLAGKRRRRCRKVTATKMKIDNENERLTRRFERKMKWRIGEVRRWKVRQWRRQRTKKTVWCNFPNHPSISIHLLFHFNFIL